MIRETPINFDLVKRTQNAQIEYVSLRELCQGGPEIGDLLINKKPIKDYQFGGPSLITEKYVYAPAYVRKWLKSGFVLMRINIENLELNALTGIEPLIHLVDVDLQGISYFNSLDQGNRLQLRF